MDEPVLPVSRVLVELPFLGPGRQPVEVVEQVERYCGVGFAELVDQAERVDLLPGVEGSTGEVPGAVMGRGVALPVPPQARVGGFRSIGAGGRGFFGGGGGGDSVNGLGARVSSSMSDEVSTVGWFTRSACSWR